MKAPSLALFVLTIVVNACGTERPNPDDYRSKPQTSVSPSPSNTKTSTTQTTADASKAPSASTTPAAPVTTPPVDKPAVVPPPPTAAAPAKAPIRTLVNATEIAAARTAYGTDCARCHQPLATTAKKGRTKAQIEAAVTVMAHVNTVGLVAKWPKDVADTTDDGVDTAMLKGQAMAEALK